MANRRSLFVALVTASTLIAGCESIIGIGDLDIASHREVEGDAAVDPRTSAGDDAANDNAHTLTHAECEWIFRCLSDFAPRTYGDVAHCEKVFLRTVSAELNAPGVAVTKAQLDHCIAAMASCDFGGACRFTGTRAEGLACSFDAQCATGSCTGPDSPCGHCTKLPGLNEPCPDFACAPGLTCSLTSTNRVCKVGSGLGEACGSDQPCASSLHSCIAGVCAPSITRGGACKSQDVSCASGLFCGASSTCESPRIAQLGQTCGVDTTLAIINVCAAGTVCDAPTELGHCVATLDEGSPCQIVPVDHCDTGLVCIGGMCRVRGSDCTE